MAPAPQENPPDFSEDEWEEEAALPPWDQGLPSPIEFPEEYLYDPEDDNDPHWGYGPLGDMTLEQYTGSAYDPEC